MNPRQRRGVLLILVTVLGAVVTFGAVFNYVQSVSSQVGPRTTVLELSKDVTELQEITAADVTAVQVPERWAPKDAVHDLSDVQGEVAAASYRRGAVLQTSMLQDPPQLTEGYREVTIMVDAETGVAGRIASGSRVDVVSTCRTPEPISSPLTSSSRTRSSPTSVSPPRWRTRTPPATSPRRKPCP